MFFVSKKPAYMAPAINNSSQSRRKVREQPHCIDDRHHDNDLPTGYRCCQYQAKQSTSYSSCYVFFHLKITTIFLYSPAIPDSFAYPALVAIKTSDIKFVLKQAVFGL